MKKIITSSIASAILGFALGVQPVAAQNNIHEVFKNKGTKSALEVNAPRLRDHILKRSVALSDWYALPASELQPVNLKAVATAKNRAGFRELRVREFSYIGDCGYSHGGQDAGVGTPITAMADFASDIANSILDQAALTGSVIDSLAIEIHSRPDTEPTGRIPYPRNFFYNVYIDSPESDATIEQLVNTAEAKSPLVQFIKGSFVVPFEIELTPSPRKKVIGGSTLEGFREYIKGKRQAILASEEAAKQRQKQNKGKKDAFQFKETTGPVVRVFPNGIRQLQIQDKYLINHDNPAYLGGTNLGMTTREGLLGVLATCITHIAEVQAAKLNLDVDSLQLEVRGTWDPRSGRPGFENVPDYPQDVKFIFRTKTPETLKTVQKWIDVTEKTCPMYNMFKDTQTFEHKVIRIKKK